MKLLQQEMFVNVKTVFMILFPNKHLFMAAYINTKRWKHVLENESLETYINSCFFEWMHNTTVYEKASCTSTYMNSTPRYSIKYMCKTSWSCIFAYYTILWHEINILLTLYKTLWRIKKSCQPLYTYSYLFKPHTWIVSFNLGCYTVVVLAGQCFDRLRETRLFVLKWQ